MQRKLSEECGRRTVLQRDSDADSQNRKRFGRNLACCATFRLRRNIPRHRLQRHPIKNRCRVDHLHFARNGQVMRGVRLRVVTAILRCGREAHNRQQQPKNRYLHKKVSRKMALDRTVFNRRCEFQGYVSQERHCSSYGEWVSKRKRRDALRSRTRQ